MASQQASWISSAVAVSYIYSMPLNSSLSELAYPKSSAIERFLLEARRFLLVFLKTTLICAFDGSNVSRLRYSSASRCFFLLHSNVYLARTSSLRDHSGPEPRFCRLLSCSTPSASSGSSASSSGLSQSLFCEDSMAVYRARYCSAQGDVWARFQGSKVDTLTC